jgi:hypothetical protein
MDRRGINTVQMCQSSVAGWYALVLFISDRVVGCSTERKPCRRWRAEHDRPTTSPMLSPEQGQRPVDLLYEIDKTPQHNSRVKIDVRGKS